MLFQILGFKMIECKHEVGHAKVHGTILEGIANESWEVELARQAEAASVGESLQLPRRR